MNYWSQWNLDEINSMYAIEDSASLVESVEDEYEDGDDSQNSFVYLYRQCPNCSHGCNSCV